MPRNTCINCESAVLSENLSGMLSCIKGMASGEVRNRFTYKAVSFSTSRSACSAFVLRAQPLKLSAPPPAQQPILAEEKAFTEQVGATRAPMTKRRDELFPADVFL